MAAAAVFSARDVALHHHTHHDALVPLDIIIRHSAVKETNKDFAALERADKVKQQILNMRFTKRGARFPASHILKFSYDFPLLAPSWKQLNPGPDKNGYLAMLELLYKNIVIKNDLPITGEPQDPRRGVWVFLIDCVAGQ